MSPTIRSRLVAVGIGAALATGGVTVATAALTLSGEAAGAAGSRCVAWAAVPSRVALGSHTVLRPQLTGTSGCYAGGLDAGATATLFGPGRKPNEQRWERFGAREQVDLYRGLDRPGTYTFSGGDVQTYDANEVRVPASWRTTTMIVKYGSRFVQATGTRSTSRATLESTTAGGSQRSAGTTVTLQRRTSNGWQSVGSKRTSRDGTVAFTHTPGVYRLVAADTSSTWGTSTVVR